MKGTANAVLLFALLVLPVRSQKPATGSQDSFQTLQGVANTYSGVLGRRVTVGNRSLTIDLSHIPYRVLTSKPDHLTPALEVLVRAQLIKQDLSAQLPNEAFWKQPLDQIEKIPPQLVQLDKQGYSEDQWQSKSMELEDQAQQLFDQIDKGLTEYASKANLEVERPRGPLSGYAVRVFVGPPVVRVRYMTAGDFLRHDDTLWKDLNDRDPLIGKFHYIVDWPNHPVEGNFEVLGPNQQLHFSAPK
jgi:hypothetical protein